MINTFWGAFKQESSKVFGELLNGKIPLSYTNDKTNISVIKKELQTGEYVKVDVLTTQGSKEGIFSFLFSSLTALNIEFYMLQGFQEAPTNTEITETALDASKEFVQNITDNLSSFLTTSDLGIFEFEIKNVEVLNSKDDIKTEDFLFFTSFLFESQEFEHYSNNDFFILLDPYTSNVFEPSDETETIFEDEDIEDEDFEDDSQENIVVSISDCMNQKKLYLEEIQNIKLLLNIELKLMVILGSKRVLLRDVVNFKPGSLIELEQKVDTPLDIWINNSKIGEGEIVVIESDFGIQITKISSVIERLSKIKYKAADDL